MSPDSSQASAYPEDKFAFFNLPDKKFPISGGIVQVNKENHTAGVGAVKLYIYVNDLEGVMEVRNIFLVAKGFEWIRWLVDVFFPGAHGL
jgi:hypothetical protein